MSKSDQWVMIFFVTVALIYVSTLIVGLVVHRVFYLMAIVNLISASSIIIYWIQKQIRITQHIFEGREIIALGLEAIVIVVTAYSMAPNQWSSWQKVFQYIVFGIHLTALLLFIIFLLTFKMKKLF